MDDNVLKKLEEHTQCSICLDIYSDPRQLQCHHVFCSSCLEDVLRSQQHSHSSLLTSIACPSCRKETKLPTGSVKDIQPAFHMSSLLDITSGIDLSQVSSQDSSLSLPTQSPRSSLSSETHASHAPDSDLVQCSSHQEEPVKLYCDTCGEAICFLCAISGGAHHSHAYTALPDAFDKHRSSVEALLASLSEGQERLSGILGQVESAGEDLKEQEASVEREVLESFRELHAVLEKRQAEVLDRLREETRAKVKALASRKDELEVTESTVARSVDVLRSNLSSGNLARILKAKKGIEKHKEELSCVLQRSSHFADIGKLSFQPSESGAKACREFGSLVVSGKPDPAQSYVELSGSGYSVCQVGETYVVAAFVINSDGRPMESYVDLSCTADLIPDSSSGSSQVMMEGEVKKVGANKYEVLFLPSVVGSYTVHIKLLDQHIQNSPFQVTIRESGTTKSGGGAWSFLKMNGIRAVAVSPVDGSIVVAKFYKPCIVVLNSSGDEVCSFGQFGFGTGHLNGVSGVAVNDRGEIAVADTNNSRVTLYGAEGKFISSVGSKHSKTLAFDHPHSVVFNTFCKRWYVLDNKDVYILKKSMEFVSSFGQKGVFKRYPLRSPQGLACTTNGNVFVSDSGNDRVILFAPNGTPLASMTLSSPVHAPLSIPTALVCAGGLLYVCGKNSDRVYVYKTNGELVSLLRDQDDAEGCVFKTPISVAVDPSGKCYVADTTGLRKIRNTSK